MKLIGSARWLSDYLYRGKLQTQEERGGGGGGGRMRRMDYSLTEIISNLENNLELSCTVSIKNLQFVLSWNTCAPSVDTSGCH